MEEFTEYKLFMSRGGVNSHAKNNDSVLANCLCIYVDFWMPEAGI